MGFDAEKTGAVVLRGGKKNHSILQTGRDLRKVPQQSSLLLKGRLALNLGRAAEGFV